MSPFCRTCLGIARKDEVRCPKDSEFYLKRSCPGCEQELFPREAFCCHCGMEVEHPDEVLLLPPAAPWSKVIAAMLMDMGSGALVLTMASSSNSVFMIVLGLLLAFAYRVLGRAGGRQTLGQAVFNLVSVSASAGPLSLKEAARRTILELGLWPLALFKPDEADRRAEGISQAYEVQLA